MGLYLGCPIWSFKGWVGNFYPKGTKPADFLREYARRLTTIEGNTTFYAVPSQKTLQQWVAEMPETFRFCPKVPRAISHEGKLTEHTAAAQQFVEVMSQLGTRLGPMFLQLPPHYSPRLLDDLKAFLKDWPSDVRLGVEVRHLDWFESPHHETLNELLSSYNMARVVIDTRPIRSLDGDKLIAGSVYQSLLEARARKPDVPILPERTADFVFLRYIGHPQMEVNTPFIEEWVSFLTEQLREGAGPPEGAPGRCEPVEGSDAYVFCHSPDNLIAPWLCREFHTRISAGVPLAPLPWDDDGTRPDHLEQGRLF
jgi:uncharacterized protein YecE (DUF72 family)